MVEAMAEKRSASIPGDSISTAAGCNPAGFRVCYEDERCKSTGVRAPGDTCAEPSCVGCLRAGSTSDKWLCVCNRDDPQVP